MRRFAKGICLCLVLVMLLTTTAFAVEPRASNYFMCSSVYLWKTTGTSFEAWFEVTGTGTMSQIGASQIEIQESSDNSNWTTVATYSSSDNSQMLDYNTASHSGYVLYTGKTGYYYRAVIELYAKNSSGTGVMTRYTASIKY